MRYILGLIILIFFSCCKKDKGLPLLDTPNNDTSEKNNFVAFSFLCDTLPKEPSFGWEDTTSNDQKNIYYWVYNPSNSNEVIYVNYIGELFTYNLRTYSKKFIDNDIMSLPQFSKNGWITYDKLDFNSYIVKTNGDSLLKLNGSMPALYPKWDHTGNFVYYSQNNIWIKIDKKGVKKDSLSSSSAGIAFCKNSDNYLFSSSINIYLKNVTDNSQTFLFSDPNNILHVTFSNDDKIVYWWDYVSLQSFNIVTQKRDTLVKFCKNFSVRGLNISANSDKLTMSCTFQKQIGSKWKLYRENIPIEMDLKTKEWRKLLVQF